MVHPLVKEAAEILDRLWEQVSRASFLYCALVGAYLAILLNNAVSYYTASIEGLNYQWAIFMGFAAFASSVGGYVAVLMLVFRYGSDERRLRELGEITGDKIVAEKKSVKRMLMPTMIFMLVSGGCLGSSMMLYVLALEKLIRPVP